MSVGPGHSRLPLTAAMGFALQGLRLRIGRMALVVAGIATAMAFTVALLVLERLYALVPAEVFGEGVGEGGGAFRWMWIGVALLISTAGTFNAILMSVTERVKEIGTLKCLGARDRHVMGMFLFESVFLGAVAGLLGGLAGVGIAGATFSMQAGVRYLTVPAMVVDDAAGGFGVVSGAWYRPKLGTMLRCRQCGREVPSASRSIPARCGRCGATGSLELVEGLTDRRGRGLIRPPAHPDKTVSAVLQELRDAPFMLVERSAGEAKARWQGTVSVGGPYDVDVFIPQQPGVDAKGVYRLVYSGGSQTVVVDQGEPANQGRWVRLGRVDLPAGGKVGVEVDVKAGETAVADRVRVDNAGACPLVQMLPWILYGGGIATLLSLVAAVVPVRIAAKVEPAAAMRYEV